MTSKNIEGVIKNNYYHDTPKIQKDFKQNGEGTADSRKSHIRNKSGRETKKADQYLKSLLKEENDTIVPT